MDFAERDVWQAIKALKKGAYLLKYGRRGKPKFCPFRLSHDEQLLIWYSGKREKHLLLNHVSRIIPGQRTAIFQRYPQPKKEYQSFSLIYTNRSLDLICKDKDEAEIWLIALRTLISREYCHLVRSEARSSSVTSDSPPSHTLNSPVSELSSSSSAIIYKDPGDSRTTLVPYESSPQGRLGRAFSEVLTYATAEKAYTCTESVEKSLSLLSSDELDDTRSIASATGTFRTSISSARSSSSQISYYEDINNSSDVYIWGEGIGDGLLGGGTNMVGNTTARMDALLPKALESTLLLDPYNIACGSQHAVLVTQQRQLFSWGEGSGGRLGHGVEEDVSYPKLIDVLGGSKIELVACGEFHTCAVTVSGDLYTWGDGGHNFGLLGHGSEVSHWTPKIIMGKEALNVSFISCGPWHTAFVTTDGKLFTFGDGTFGALGHGDRSSSTIAREVENLKGLRTVKASCGAWHTAAVVEVTWTFSSDSSFSGKLFTWGDGDKGQLGQGDREPRLLPSRVTISNETSFCQVACGHIATIALTTLGQVYAMGADFGQLCISQSVSKVPTRVEGNIRNNYIEEIACGSHHVAVLSSKAEVYTWGKGANGQLGHGDNHNRKSPTLVEALKHKQIKKVACGSNYTAVICLHKCLSGADNSICSGCRSPFNFRRKRHNCYNCGLLFCVACSSKKSIKAALAPNSNKPYRVCDDCSTKLKRIIEPGSTSRLPKIASLSFNAAAEKGTLNRRSIHQRPASFDSSKPSRSQLVELGTCQHYSIPNGSFQWESTSACASVPGSKMVSRATSPWLRKSSPAYLESMTSALTNLEHPEISVDVSNQKNGNLTKEIRILKEQVDELACKSQNLETELTKTSRQLGESTVTAREEAEKTKSAKKLVISLTTKLRNMTKKVPQ